MFTGLVSGIGEVREIKPIGDGRDMRLTIAAPWRDTGSIPIGASISCAGCCLTAVAVGQDWFAVEVSAETLARTELGAWRPGSRLNLERSLRLGDELGGHIVSGHVDGTARVVEVRAENGSYRVVFDLTPELSRFVAEKGSVAVDGVSLTVNHVSGTRFGVNLIPHTWSATTLGLLRAGDRVHIEIDMLARYVARLAEAR